MIVETPGKGYRWRVEDAGTVTEQGAAYYPDPESAEAAAVRALGTDWPGAPASVFHVPSDAESAGWHYVGADGEPAFENEWTNMAGQPSTAFRIREPAIVDVHFIVQDGTAQTVFTLPEDYRPSAMTPVAGMVVAYTDLSPLTAATAPTVMVDTDGTVILSAVEPSLVAGGAIGYFYLDPPTLTA